MNKKKAGLLIIVLFLIIGLGSFVFANPDNQENFEEGDIEERDRLDGDSDTDDNGNTDSEESESNLLTDGTDSQSDNNQNTLPRNNLGNYDSTGFTTGPSGNDNGPITVEYDYYADALRAVENAESSLAQGDVDYAASLVDKVTNQSQKDELNKRLDAVRDIIDVTSLIERLEEMVANSTNRDGIENSITYRDDEKIEELVTDLNNGTAKDNLANRLETVNKILNDSEGPVISGIINNSFTNDNVSLTISDDNEVTTTVTLDGNPVDYADTFDVEGTYVVTVVDKAFNEASKTFTIDRTKPVVGGVEDGKYYNTDVEVTIDDTNPGTVHLKKNGETVKPYNAGDPISEEGTYTVYVSDKAGNKSTTITFTIDKHVEEPKWVYILNLNDENNRKTIRNGQTLRVEVNFDEELTELPVLTIGNSQSTTFRECSETDYAKYICVADLTIDNTIANLEDGEIPFTITNIYDKAGNTITLDNANVTETKEYGQVTYDGTAPVIRSLGIVNLDEFKDEVGRLYAKTGDTVRVRLYFDEELGTEPTVKLGGKEFTATYRENSPKYAYYADIELTEDMNLSDGILSFEVYGYKDAIGNVGVNLTQDNINETAYPSVTIDNTLPVLNFNNGFITSGYTVEATDDNFAYMTVQYYDGRGTETIEGNTFTLDKAGDNTRYNIKAYDKAGNVSEYRNIYLDTEKPVVGGTAINGGKEVSVENNGTYQEVTLNISDGSLKKVSLVKEDGTEEVLETYKDNFKNTKITFEKKYTEDEEGTYTFKAVDRNNNESTITFTIDNTPATRVYSTLDFDKSGKQYYEIDKEKVYYVKNGDSFVFRMQFSEELKTAPTVKVGGMEVPMTLNEKILNNEGKYIYEGTVNITEEAKLSQGRLEIVLSNVVDMAGNESTDEVVLNQTPTGNSRVAVYDKTEPSATKVQIINNSNPNSEYIKNGETVRVRATFNEKLASAPVLTIGNYTATFENVGDGKGNDLYSADITIKEDESELTEGKIAFKISGYTDLAGNPGNEVTESALKSNITYDRTAPVYRSLGIYGGEQHNNAWYVTNGDKVYINVHFNEKLAVSPYVKVNGKDVFQYGNPVEKETDDGEKYYIYSKVYKVNETDGKLSFEIYGYADAAGNIGKTLTATDTKIGDQNGNIIVDNTMPKVDIGGTTGNKYWFREQVVDVTITEANLDSVYYALNGSNNDKSMYNILDSDKAIKIDSKDIIDNGDGTYTAKVTINEEGRYMLNIKAIDKAGNTTYTRWGWYQIDRTNPTIVLHKNKEESSIEPGLHNYCVSATVSDDHMKSIKLNDVDYESDTYICDDGNYTLTATDIAGNPKTINFQIDRTAPVISINGENFTGEKNDYKFYNKVNLSVIEDNGYTAWVNGKEVNISEYNFNKDGEYTVKVRDNAGTNTIVKFTVDTIPATKVELRVNSSNDNNQYAKIGDSFGIYLTVDEELKEDPTFTVNGKEYKVNQPDGRKVGDNLYQYAVVYKVTDDMEEGEIEFTISNIYDKAGNPLNDLSNSDANGKVIIDKTAPTATITYSTTDSTNHDVNVTLNTSEDVKVLNAGTWHSDDEYATEFKKAYQKNGTQTVTIEDRAGNQNTVEVVINNIDKDAPELVVDTIVDGVSNTENPQVHAIDDNEFSVVIKLNGEVVRTDGSSITTEGNYSTWYGIGYLADGNYEVTATDSLGNSKTITFELNRSE